MDGTPALLVYSSPERSASASRFRFSPGMVVGLGGPKEPPLCEIAPCGRFAEDRYPIWVAAERGDVLLEPLKARDHVQQAVVPGCTKNPICPTR